MISLGRQTRGDEPSASSFGRYFACPGSYLLEKTVPAPPTSPWAESGTRIHAKLAGEEVVLNQEEHDLADRCLNQHSELVKSLNLGEVQFSVVERRFWSEGGKWSGQIDRIDFFFDGTMLVTDWKTGRSAVNHADRNLQLRASAVLAARAYPSANRIFTCIIQPLTGEPTLSLYDKESLQLASMELEAIVASITSVTAPRVPSPEACHYCKAKAVCPELSSLTSQLSEKVEVMELSNESLAEYLNKAEVVEDLIEELRSEAKRRLIAGADVPGRVLKPGRNTRVIADASAAYSALSEQLDASTFAGCCKVSVPALEKALAARLGLKGKAPREALERALGQLMETKTGDPILSKE